jgi:hypothetical protein
VKASELCDDDRLLALLRAAVDTTDPIPYDAIATARAVFGLTAVDSELAVIVFDSFVEAGAAGVRSSAGCGPRSLSFETAAVTIDVEVQDEGDVIGQIVPGDVRAGRVETVGGFAPIGVEPGGRFRTTIGEGRFRLRFDVGSGSVTTPWIKR